MKIKTICIIIILLVSLFELSFAQKGFMKIGDIKGESTNRGHVDWINIEGFSQALEKEVATTGATRRRSTVSFSDLVFIKKLDKSSPKLMEACAKGKVIPKVELDMVTQNGRTYYSVYLEKVLITGINSQSHCDPNCEVREEVSISYSKITWEYINENGEIVSTSYDVRSGN